MCRVDSKELNFYLYNVISGVNHIGERGSTIQLKALFTDYDGTLSPINISRVQSAVPQKIRDILQKISTQIPVAVITTKDLEFVAQRTPFACAWATLGGLEITVNRVTLKAPCLSTKQTSVKKALGYAKKLAANNLTLEMKRDSNGDVVAFSVDWRNTSDKGGAIAMALEIAAYSEKLLLTVIWYGEQPFFDVFPCPINKGASLQALKEKLSVQDGVLYLGDSATDNAAFEKADVSIGVLHEETPNNLVCKYFIKAEELLVFLEALQEADFCFDARWPMILTAGRGY
jgi:trehalose-phosphatase